jgi:hypothetical protein
MRFRALGLAVAAFGLFACNQLEKPSGLPAETGETGLARVSLPALPPEYLAKIGSSAIAQFVLTITGPGMATIRNAYPLASDRPNAVAVTGIPIGPGRVFTGQLFRIDTLTRDTVLTHEGRDTAAITRDSVAEVRLFLTRGSGSAHVCVEVEGWPVDTTNCIRPPIPHFAFVQGCWAITVVKKGPSTGFDSLFTGKMHIDQTDSSLQAIITWKSGAKDSARGTINEAGTVFLGPPYTYGQFHLKASVAPSDTVMTGDFSDSLRRIAGSFRASRSYCGSDTDTVIVVPPPDSANRACFSISETLSGKSHTGRLALEQVQGWYWGVFHWTGFGGIYTGWDPVHGDLKDTANLDLHTGVLPGLLDSTAKVDTLGYKILIYPTGTFNGQIRRVRPAPAKSLGTWKATRTACKEGDFVL